MSESDKWILPETWDNTNENNALCLQKHFLLTKNDKSKDNLCDFFKIILQEYEFTLSK